MISANHVFILFISCFLTISPGIAQTPHLIPFPTPRPVKNDAPQKTSIHLGSTKTTSSVPLKAFFRAYGKKQAQASLDIKNTLHHPLDRLIAEWMVATGSGRGFSYQTLGKSAAQVKGWPGQGAMTLAQERALINAGQASGTVARALPARPVTDDGKILQIRSLLANRNKGEAAAKLRNYWVSENFTASRERHILKTFGSLLHSTHHKARADRLLYDDRASGALRLLPFINKRDHALIKARTAVIRRQKNAGQLLAKLPQHAKQNASYHFSLVQHLRRADKWVKAGKAMMSAPKDPALLVDQREWWIERRMVSRKVLEAGHPRLAYQIAADYQSSHKISQIDAEFHAGWYALRFLDTPNIALRHFNAISRMSNKPLSQSRAFYWTARAHQASGNNTKATENYRTAGRYSHTYYGQLALQALGKNSISLPNLPSTDSARAHFEERPFVRVIRRLNEVGQKGRTGIFYRHLASTLKNPAEITLLSALADKNHLYPISLQVGKLGFSKGVAVPRLAFPLGAIPKGAKISRSNKALAYAIARQESAFDITAVSRANARGLMQLLPETAKRTARSIGIPYKAEKLTRDGAYNARLGSAFLGQLIKRFGGSHVLAIAGYNAGPRRSDEWISRFGDPRKNAVDAVDWVEFIPFAETRNYVQRVMENYQVYRHRLDNAPLTIKRDLNHGQPS